VNVKCSALFRTSSASIAAKVYNVNNELLVSFAIIRIIIQAEQVIVASLSQKLCPSKVVANPRSGVVIILVHTTATQSER
jgi:hypothetical protein